MTANPFTWPLPASLAHGIATVYQDLAVVSLMEVWRNFFLGSEMSGSKFPLSGLKIKDMKRIADEELRKMGIVVKDINHNPDAGVVAADPLREDAPGDSSFVCRQGRSHTRHLGSIARYWSVSCFTLS